jgi:hypothetical protein
MAEPTKDELVQTASDLGVPNADDMTKAELAEAIDARNPEALGPVVPPGRLTPQPPTSNGPTITGVQPATTDDIPEAAR